MATIKFKVVPRKNPLNKIVKYYPQKLTYSNIGPNDVVDYAVQNSNIERSVIEQAMIGLEEAINNFLLNGHNIQFWPLGSFFTTITSRGASDPKEFKPSLIRKLRINFTPSPQLKKKCTRNMVNLEMVAEKNPVTDENEA